MLSFGLSHLFYYGNNCCYFTYSDQNNDKIFKNIDDNTFLYLILLSILEVICVFLFIYATKDKDVSWIVPVTEGLIILFSVLLSIYFFSEKMTINKKF